MSEPMISALKSSQGNLLMGQPHLIKRRAKTSPKKNTIPTEIDPSVLPLLTEKTIVLLFDFLTLMHREIRRAELDAKRIEVRGSFDPEDDTSQMIVRLWLNKSLNQEPQQGDLLIGTKIASWVQKLNEEQQQLFMEQISFQVRVSPHAKAV